MIFEEIKNIRSDNSILRKFGVTMGVIFVLFGGLLFWQGNDLYTYFLLFSFLFLVSGFFLPKILTPVYKVWMGFAYVLSWIMTRVILTILFYMVFTPIGLTARCFGKDFLSRNFDKDNYSYWIQKEKKTFKKEIYENQY